MGKRKKQETEMVEAGGQAKGRETQTHDTPRETH